MERYEVTFRTWYKQSSRYVPADVGGEDKFPEWYMGIFANGRPIEGLGFSVSRDEEVSDQWEARAVLLIWAESEEEAADPTMRFNQVGMLHDQLADRAVRLLGHNIDLNAQWLVDDETVALHTTPDANRSFG